VEVKDIEKTVTDMADELKKYIQKSEDETKNNGKVSIETKEALARLRKDHDERILAVEQKLVTKAPDKPEEKSVGEMFIASPEFKTFVDRGAKDRHFGKVSVGDLFNTKATLTNATGLNQPLVPTFRVPGIIFPAQQRLTIRDLIPFLPTTGNVIQYVRETGFTNAAAPQAGEGVAKPESALTFDQTFQPVQTVAHWIPVTKQLLQDAPAIQAYINTRMRFGLKLKEETQLLSGDGTGQNLLGLITAATAYDTTRNVVGDTKIDTLRHAIGQVELQNMDATGIILNPIDWEGIELTKTTGTASSGQYIIADPQQVTIPRLWGRPVVATPSMPAGSFLVGAFAMGANGWDRMDATVEISFEHADFFTRNLAAILCEERIALTVYRPAAFAFGAFPA
jgi:HK97 family phage major capsid protein